MYGYYKLIGETDSCMTIAYSLERNKSCDGVLTYDKKTDAFVTDKLSEGADLGLTKWFAGHILYKILTGDISTARKMIAVG